MDRILLIRGGALGDLILTLPAFRMLRERWPSAHIELLGYPRLAEIGKKRYYFDSVRSVDTGPLVSFFIPNSVLDPELIDYFASFDVIISYFYDPDDLFRNNLLRCGATRLYSVTPQVNMKPAAKHFCRPMYELGLMPVTFASQVFPNDEDRAAAAPLLKGLEGRRIIAFHPGSGSEKKNWPVHSWVEWARAVGADPNVTFLMITGEADEGRARQILAGWPLTTLPLHADRWPLPVLAALLAEVQIFVGHDTGVTHLAAAAACPKVVALFGPTDPATWAPQTINTTALHKGEAVDELSVEEVVAATRG